MSLPPKRATTRLIATVLLSATILAGTAFVGAAPAQAATVADLLCVGTNHAEFSPGLTFTTRTVDIDAEGEYTTCLSSDPAVASGTYTASGQGTMSCLAGGHAGEFTITWNTGEHSTIAFTNTVALRPTGEVVVVATGSVIEGKFDGDRYDGTFTLFHLDPLACLHEPGVRSATGPTTLLFSSL